MSLGLVVDLLNIKIIVSYTGKKLMRVAHFLNENIEYTHMLFIDSDIIFCSINCI
jgi:hypothetical protein